MYGYWGYSYNPFGVLLWILFWVIVISIFIRIIRGSHFHNTHHYHRDWWKEGKDARDILKERYAKGEIDKKEFEEKMVDISKDR